MCIMRKSGFKSKVSHHIGRKLGGWLNFFFFSLKLRSLYEDKSWGTSPFPAAESLISKRATHLFGPIETVIRNCFFALKPLWRLGQRIVILKWKKLIFAQQFKSCLAVSIIKHKIYFLLLPLSRVVPLRIFSEVKATLNVSYKRQ